MSERAVAFIGPARVPWLRRLAQTLRAGALVVGALAAASAGWTSQDAAVALLLLGVLLWRARRPAGGDTRQRDEMTFELLLASVAVAATGGWSSPWLLAQLVPLGLACIAVPRRTAALLGLAVAVITSLATIGAWPPDDELLGRVSSLLLIVGFATVSRGVIVDAAGPQAESLGDLEVLWSVRALLEGLHTQAAGSRARFSVEEAVLALRSSSPQLARAEVLALLVHDDDGTLRILHALGLREGGYRVRDLPDTVGQPRRDGIPLVVPLPGGGMGRDTVQGAYLWLPLEEQEPEHVLVVEFSREESQSQVLREVARIAEPLAVTVANAAWFARVRHLGVDEERQRIAARLHDQFAQSLAAVSMELELATRRHAEDEDLRKLRWQVKDTLASLRDTMVELRAAVDEERDLPEVLAGLVDRLGERHGVVAELTCEVEGPRPLPAIEQQLLRMAQELTRRAVEDRGAIAVYVRYACRPGSIQLDVTDDGDPPTDGTARPAADVIRDRAESIGAHVVTGSNGPGLATVSVVLAHRTDRTGERQ